MKPNYKCPSCGKICGDHHPNCDNHPGEPEEEERESMEPDYFAMKPLSPMENWLLNDEHNVP